MSKPLRWAVVGTGQQMRRIAGAMSSRHQLTAIIGEDAAHAAALAKTYKASFVSTSLASVLKTHAQNIDAVCILSPNDKHTKQTILALGAGKDVLCEKPLALTFKDGAVIAKAAKRNRRQCLVDFQMRHDPAILAARDHIAKQNLGRIVHVDMNWSIGNFGEEKLPPLPKHMRWRDDPKQAGGGAIMHRGVHLFDLLRFLTRKEVLDVRSYSDATPRTVDRTMSVLMALSGGGFASITTSKLLPSSENRIIIYGTLGKIVLDVFNTSSSLSLTTEKGTLRKTFKTSNLFAKVLDAFADARKGKRTISATVDDGVKVIAITEACIASARSQKTIRVRK